MSDYVSSVLEELVPRFDGELGDWARVVADGRAKTPLLTAHASPRDATTTLALRRERAGRWHERWLTRRRLIVVAFTALLAALLVTPALGIGSRVLDLVQGTPAPPEVQTFFASSDAFMDVARDSDEVGKVLHDRLVHVPVVASEARLVFAIDTPDGPILFWVAPTKDGRHCELSQFGDVLPNGQLPLTNIAWGGQGQPPLKNEPVNGAATCEGPDPGGRGLWPGGGFSELRPSVTTVRVWFYDPTITRIEVELQDAPSVSLPVVAVGGSFVAFGTVPRAERTVAVVGRSADGTEVARESFRSGPPRSP
jgi:hypothetical protein